MAMLKKKTKAAEKKATKMDVKAGREKEKSREAHMGKVGAKEKRIHAKGAGQPRPELARRENIGSPSEPKGLASSTAGHTSLTTSGEAKSAIGRAGLAAERSQADSRSSLLSEEHARTADLSAAIQPEKMSEKELEAAVVELDILKYPLVTEKAVNMIDAENKLTFVVGGNASKPDVKRAVEDLYKVKVTGVNIIRDMKARKRAIVTLDRKFKAADVATKLGVI